MDAERFMERKELESLTRKLNRDLDAIIVEGFSDRWAMRKLGFEGKIFESAERELELLAEDIERGADRVGILTDFDSHGKEENRKLRQLLQERVDVMNSARSEFGKQLTSEGRMAIEDVAPLFEDREQKFVDAALDQLYLGTGR